MKFDYVIGNPPYQETIENTSDKPIYNYFMDVAYTIADKVELITPARFLFNVGKTPKSWNQKMLKDENFKVLLYEKDEKKIFPTTTIPGGVAITYRDANKKFGSIKYFCVYNEVRSVKEKVINSKGFKSIMDTIALQTKYNLKELYKDYPEVKEKISSNGKEKRIVSSAFDVTGEIYSDIKENEDDIKIYGLCDKKRVYKYINKKYIERNSNIDNYKVVLASAHGASGTIGKPIPAKIIGAPEILDKNTGFTQTFISLGKFKEKEEAENLYKYLLTKFARFMVGTLKATNGLKMEIWANVPVQDFSNNSNIEWNKSIKEINQQLYDMYNLTDDEISFIEKYIGEM